MYTGLPYKPLHSKAWLERFLKKNFYKKKYDRFMWWRQYTLRNAPLHKLAQLRDKIINGDFDMGPFQFEIELTQHRMNDKWLENKHEDTYREATQIDGARIKRLQEDRDKDEKNKLEELKKAFVMEFNMTTEQYDRESQRPNKSILGFYDKMAKKYGQRGWVTRKSALDLSKSK